MFGCIHVPDFAVQAALRNESQDLPIALLDGPESLPKVVACNESARMAGIVIGMTKLQAEICGVTLRKRLEEDENSAQAALIDCACHFSPRVEATAPGTIIFNLAGSERLLGEGTSVAALIRDQVADRGLHCNVAIAANPDAARYAAQGFGGVTVIEEDQERQRLSRLPIEILDLETDVLEILHAWGIRTFQALAALPTIPLTERLGQYGLHIQNLARGANQRELVPVDLPALFRECMELEDAIELLEPLGFILNRLFEQVMGRLTDRSLATDHVEIELALEINSDRDINSLLSGSLPAAVYRRSVKLPVPTQNAKVLLKLAQLDLAAHLPPAPVKKISIEALPTRVRFTQGGLFQPAAPEPAQLEVTMARIRALVGEGVSHDGERVGFPCLTDSHRPDDFTMGSSAVKHIDLEPSVPRLALRRFRPALAARVELNEKQVPVGIAFQRKKGKVMDAAGPWRRGGEWWDAAGRWLREEWDLHVGIDGAAVLYRVYRDLSRKQWFVEGMYD